MSQPQLFTYFDAQSALDDFVGRIGGVSAAPPVVRRAIQTAYREIVSIREWRCLIRNGRIHLDAAQTDGTIAYDNTTREVTLTDSTWPSWAADGSIRISDRVSDVESRDSDTVITLDATLNHGEDVDAETSYRLYPRYYVLPADFASLITATMEDTTWRLGTYITPEEMFAKDKYRDVTGDILYYTVAAVQDLYGSMGLYVWPASDSSEPIDFAYRRRPRNLRYSGHDVADTQGTVSVTAGSPTVVGSGTDFSDDHVGSIMRIGGSTTARPTGMEDNSPWKEERCIVAVTDTTHLTLDANASTTRAGVKSVITDPIDLDVSLFDAFMRLCEKHLVLSLSKIEGKDYIIRAADEAIFRAKCADGKDSVTRVAGIRRVPRMRLYELDSSRS